MKKGIIVILCLILLSGCQGNNGLIKTVSNPYKQVEKLQNYAFHEHHHDVTEDDPDFANFCKEEVIKTLEKDYLSTHFTLEDPASFGMEKPEVTLGEITLDFQKASDDLSEDLKALQAFDYAALSYRQQIDYDVYEYSLLEALASLAYGQYQLLFDTGNSVHVNLLTNFTEYVFHDEEDIRDYLVLLQDIDRYFEDAMTFTKTQAEMGIALQDFTLDSTLEFINGFTAKVDDNELIVTFDEKINETELSDDLKESLKAENKKIVQEEVIPAYTKLATELESLRGMSSLDDDDAGAYEYDKGYGEMLGLLKASDNLKGEDLFDKIYDGFIDGFIAFMMAAQDEDTLDLADNYIMGAYEDYAILQASPEEKLAFLSEAYKLNYPAIEQVAYTFDALDPSVADPSILAYYMNAPYDNPQRNVIRTNPVNLGDDPDASYSTLAHEGFPGHLYQHAYFASTNPGPLREIVSFLGYSEGFAVRASADAYDYLGVSEDVSYLIAFNNVAFPYALQSLCDYGINVFGWNKDEMVENMSVLIDFDDEMATAVYEAAVSGHCQIVPYGFGYVELYLLEEAAKEDLGASFDEIAFNQMILQNGPVPFPLLERILNEN